MTTTTSATSDGTWLTISNDDGMIEKAKISAITSLKTHRHNFSGPCIEVIMGSDVVHFHTSADKVDSALTVLQQTVDGANNTGTNIVGLI